MVFSSFTFIFLFMPALLLCSYLLPARFRSGRNLILLAFSLFFYGYGGPKFLLLMLASICVNYLGGLLSAPGRKGRKAAITVTVSANLLLLGWFKYAGFFGQTIASVFSAFPVPDVTLPIGISFFTFQGMSYALDVYRGDTQVQRNPLWIALYVSLFPQLVAGPIVRYATVADEIQTRTENLSEFSDGLTRFFFGLAKKMLIANQMAALADAVFAVAPTTLSVTLSWLGAVAYTGQIYFDFSAYSDMAIGLGKMFGFHFLENFNYPYISQSISEFWRRWHISLSTWFRDYVYIPLGGNRCSTPRHLLNLLAVWSLTGFWHGAAWNFLLWGLYFFLLLAGERFLWGTQLGKAPRPLRHVYALFFIILGWVLFRSESLSYAGGFLSAMFGGGNGFTDRRTIFYLLQYRYDLLLALIASLPWKNWLSGWMLRWKTPVSQALQLWIPKFFALAFFALSFLRLISSSYNPFIYFRF